MYKGAVSHHAAWHAETHDALHFDEPLDTFRRKHSMRDALGPKAVAQ